MPSPARFNYRTVNYAKVYYACGRCDGKNTKPEGKEYGPYSVSKTLVKIEAEKPDPKIEVQEVRTAF